MSKTQKTNKQFEKEQTKGRIRFQKRTLAEQEANQEIMDVLQKKMQSKIIKYVFPEKYVPDLDHNKHCYVHCGDRCNCQYKEKN